MDLDLSKSSFALTTREVACPRCGAAAGQPCVFPKGRRAATPHKARLAAYRKQIGPEEYTRRHSVMITE